MRVGVPKEIKDNEYRVGLVPASVSALARGGHQVLVEAGAGVGAGITDEEYRKAGASIVPGAAEVFAQADMIVKVKEPQASERARLRKDQILFTYLHLAADLAQTKDLMRSGAVCIAYETVMTAEGVLPLLTPMSEVAGRLGPQVGAACLEKSHGGRGVLLGGVPGVPPGRVAVIGCGVAGENAIKIAVGMGADVVGLDRSVDALRRIASRYPSVRTVFSTPEVLAAILPTVDLVIGAALVPGAVAPKIVSKAMVQTMKPGSVVVDISIDQGGCIETSHVTTHSHPTYVVDGVVHYCVGNMPGAVARTSTFALNNVTSPFVNAIANKGWKRALAEDKALRHGLNVCEGQLTSVPVAEAHGLTSVPPEKFLPAN